MTNETVVNPGDMVFVRDEGETMILRVISDDGDTLTAETVGKDPVAYSEIPKEICRQFEKRD